MGWRKGQRMARKPYGTVSYRDVDRAGLRESRKNDPPGPDRDDEWVALVADGWTYEAVGRLYGVGRSRVHQVIHQVIHR